MQEIRDCLPLVILIDISVPKIKDQEILQAIKAEVKTTSIPIVVLGMLLDYTTEKMQSFRYGAADYVSKYSGPDELLTRVQYQVDWQLVRLQQAQLNADLESRLEERDQLLDLARDIIELGQQVLGMACGDIARWVAADAIGIDLTVSVNIAAQQLLQPGMLADLCGN